MVTKDALYIRAMKSADIKECMPIMANAFKSKMLGLKEKTIEEIASLLELGKAIDKDNLEGHFVATVNNKVLGVIHLNWYEQNRLRVEPKIDLRRMIKEIGFGPVILSGISLMLLNEKVLKGEVMIDFIAVDPKYRGIGIGSNLIEYGEVIAKRMTGIKSYSLHVIGSNYGAIKLYEQHGFNISKTFRHPLSYRFTSVKVHHYMEKLL